MSIRNKNFNVKNVLIKPSCDIDAALGANSFMWINHRIVFNKEQRKTCNRNLAVWPCIC